MDSNPFRLSNLYQCYTPLVEVNQVILAWLFQTNVVKLSIKSNQIKSNLDLIEIDTKLKFPPPTTTHPKLLKSYKSAITRWILVKLSQKLLKDVLSNLILSPGSSTMSMSSQTPGKDLEDRSTLDMVPDFKNRILLKQRKAMHNRVPNFQ